MSYFDEPIEETRVGPYAVKVLPEPDGSPFDPMEFESVFAITYRADARCVLGNEPVSDPEAWIADLARRADSGFEAFEERQWEAVAEHRIDTGEAERRIVRRARKTVEAHYVMLPVFAHVHSGVALRAGEGFSCKWDSGQSGFVYARKADVRDMLGVRRLTASARKRAEKVMRAIVQEYGEWLNGEVYGVVVEDEDGDVVESIGGFIGIYSGGIEAAMDEGKRIAQGLVDRDAARLARFCATAPAIVAAAGA